MPPAVQFADLHGDCLRQVARRLSTPDAVCLASTCRYFRQELKNPAVARFGYRRRRCPNSNRPVLFNAMFKQDVAEWARSCPSAAAATRCLVLKKVGYMAPTFRTIRAMQSLFGGLQNLVTLHMELCGVPPEFLANLPRGLRALSVHRVCCGVLLTGSNLGRLRDLERLRLAGRGLVAVRDVEQTPRLRDVRLSTDADIDWDVPGWSLDVLALHAPKVNMRQALTSAACMSISAVKLLFDTAMRPSASCPVWAPGVRHLRILVDDFAPLLDVVPYNNLHELETLEFMCECPVVPFELLWLPRLRHVSISHRTLVVFEDRVLDNDGVEPSSITWTFSGLTTWKTRRYCQDLCWAPPPPNSAPPVA
jgi:hypothetical protein